jgi:plastocyanin
VTSEEAGPQAMSSETHVLGNFGASPRTIPRKAVTPVGSTPYHPLKLKILTKHRFTEYSRTTRSRDEKNLRQTKGTLGGYVSFSRSRRRGGDSGTNNGGSSGGPVATNAVTVCDNFFEPTDILVSPSALVTWTWSANVDHNVTFDPEPIVSSTQTIGSFQSAMPTTPGTYNYKCTIHGDAMNGSVQIQ